VLVCRWLIFINFLLLWPSALRLQDLTPRAKDSLVSFGERMSTRIFASFLRVNGVAARQFDAPEIGVVTSDDFGNADILYDQTLSKVRWVTFGSTSTHLCCSFGSMRFWQHLG
jgi:aspartokinase